MLGPWVLQLIRCSPLRLTLVEAPQLHCTETNEMLPSPELIMKPSNSALFIPLTKQQGGAFCLLFNSTNETTTKGQVVGAGPLQQAQDQLPNM